jgi:LuxR family maltose regulon positive regulatory protein
MIIKSKLAMPEKRQDSIVRKRLLPADNRYKLGLICAPAGYGKTTAIIDWAEDKEHSAWFNIDSFDDNIIRFFTYFVHALDLLEPLSCAESIAALQKNQTNDSIELFTLLLNDICECAQPVTLILDNYQYIKNRDIHRGIAFFIKNMPDSLQLIIASRTIPPLPVSNLRIRQQLLQVDERNLAFTVSETEQFFSHCTAFYCNPEIQEQLCNAVSGWPTALQLVSILSKDSATFSEYARLIGQSNHAYLWDYLEEEVFSPLDEKLQAILLAIAPLKRVDGELVNQLCAIHNGPEQLALLQTLGIFINPVDNQQQFFALTPFFRAFLIHKLKHSGKIKESHKSITQLYLARGDIDEALPHALLSEEPKLLTKLLKEAGWQLLDNGELEQLNRCFAIIADDIWQMPELVLLKAWMLQSYHQTHQVIPLLEKAETVFTSLSKPQKSGFSVIQAQIAVNQGKINEASALAKSVLAAADNLTARIKLTAQAVIAEADKKMGQLPLAYQRFQKLKESADDQNLQQGVIWSLYQQAKILQAQSDHNNAQRHIDIAIALINKYQLQKLPLYTLLLHFKAYQAYQRSDFQEAEYLCEHALKIVLPYGEQWCLYSYTLLAKIALAKGELTKVAKLLTEFDKPLHSQHFYHDSLIACDDVRILYWQASGDIGAIDLWLYHNQPLEPAFNCSTQCHNRNRARALLKLDQLQEAERLLKKNLADAQNCQLKIELNRNLILLACIKSRLKQMAQGKEYLSQAIKYSLQTGLTLCFVCEADDLKPLYQELARDPALHKPLKEKLVSLLSLSGIRLYEAPKMPFDSTSVIKIKSHALVPRLIKNIHLTPREWQVLGYIHSGYRNPQIARAMGVAATTVKSHIRNLYQKLGLEDRNEALQLSAKLVALLE